ncbi:MAG: hypothetical protein HeimC2_04960 [Candidatus Heimdallarchaeota archaeon LC_2]|nr:MAG: hypothetical protein HeimC2_04960 [Candidatus Heimdallarchaeota archaeon LC_2]
MHCKNCGTHFIRYPCPYCGQKEIIEQTISENEIIASMVIQESLQKPSELKGGSATKPIEKIPEDPSLLKPSEMNPDRRIDPTDPYNEKVDQLVKPSELKGLSSLNSQLSIKRTTTKVKITPANLNLEPLKETLNGNSLNKNRINPQRLEGETDDEYKNRVRDTLLEVMSLLEKLIE